MTTTRPRRDPYLNVGTALRHAIETANTAELTPTQHRALLAVIHYTTSRSYLGAHVWLGQIADITYGLEPGQRAEQWQLDKTRKALAALREHGIIEAVAPRGRPAQPSYWVALPVPASTAQERADLDQDQHGPGTGRASDPSTAQERADLRTARSRSSTARSRRQHGPIPAVETPPARPGAGPPSEVKAFRGFTEESFCRAEPDPNGSADAPPNGTDSGAGSDGDDWDPAGPLEPLELDATDITDIAHACAPHIDRKDLLRRLNKLRLDHDQAEHIYAIIDRIRPDCIEGVETCIAMATQRELPR